MMAAMVMPGPVGGVTAPPGWYPDPWGHAPMRYFDGVQWTPHLGPPIARSSIDANDPTMRMLLPVGRTPLSIVAGYVGLCSILLVPAPFALWLGIWALMQLRSQPEKAGRGRAIFAIVAGALGTAVLAIIVVGAIVHHASS